MSKIRKKLLTLKNTYIRRVKSPIKAILPLLPLEYQIEPINYCNLRCPTCSSLRLGDVKKRWMRTEEFVKIADQLPAYSSIYLTDLGEPFLNPEIFSIIKEGEKRGFIIRIDSNFNYDPKLNYEIVTSGLDIIRASIDGASQETYEKFRQGGDFNLTLHNLKEMARLKVELKSSTPEIIWQFIVNRYNEHEMKTAKKMAAQLPDNVKVMFIPMGLRQDKIELAQYSDEEMEKMKKKWLPLNKKYIMPYFRKKNPRAINAPVSCSWLWNWMNVTVNLDVVPCCHTYMPAHSFGNLKDSTLLEIWNNQAYTTSRKLFLDPSYRDCRTICSRCPNYLRGKVPNVIVRHWHFFQWFFQRAIFNLYDSARSK